MFESCHSPTDVAHLLRARFGFPVRLFAGRPFLSCGGRVDAVSMPAELGRQVRERLRAAPATPAVADPRNRRWVFLTATPQPYYDVTQHLRLTAYEVAVLTAGRRVMLPASDYPLGWHWASEPVPGPLLLPARAMVLRAVRESLPIGAGHVPA
ncbi:hypothetical protein BJY24_001491 [Nocardia transvalensis]|uniref:Uncharacterized protein n=1 Tax=Nocardia transvalensis TaxID=37333 RepID=A0A7W9PAQ4_9NOCA|nr:hypothetical protein [Nocardia transvalensis]MBB5912624.1 hypothetical protein [Nocardia transvalensis]